ncbi:hypothetical protein ACFLKB_06425 [Clostridium sp. FAM 1755]|uniref:Uncharacterized protein n=2 Tax=Clostridium TaxID=1485 RepID=A0A6M0T1P6_CLOBO|nr:MULTISPECIES: hypothetical protein [Clostridium]EJP6473603.1 hypothetical protein [Clostridium botulinum]KOR26258.1 hypothetical protein ND00_08790 [Clostridium sp. L74]MDS1002141.1 hypothetical protein [Clostridium sporogenes]NFA61434.1 hypothetical protein [Clostridium botulinum]NFI73321.1 hypothetical protein [Clostridium sporogenes]
MPFTSNNSWKISGVLLFILILFLANFLIIHVLPVALIAGAILFGIYKLVNYIKSWRINKKGFSNRKNKENSFEKFSNINTNDIPDISQENVIDVDYEEV